MKEISKIFFKTLLLFLVVFSVKVHSKILSDGNADAKVIVKVFSSLTCPACANFHSEIYYDLKKGNNINKIDILFRKIEKNND